MRHAREDTSPIQSWDVNVMPWQAKYLAEIDTHISVKPLIKDPETGMSVEVLKYFSGDLVNTWHTHNCAHGMYVLDGILKTHAGLFGPGSFVWFPEGGSMEHGATADDDVTVLFITNKPFDIHYDRVETENSGKQ